MKFRIALPAAFIISQLLASCGGGGNDSPYDGTWEAVYPVDFSSNISETRTVVCSTPPATLIIKDSAGTTTQNTTCTTTILATDTTPASSYTETVYFKIGVTIEGRTDAGERDVLNAVVNGITLTGTCISTVACSAVSAAGDTLSLTR